MSILVTNTFATYKAQIRSSLAGGFKQLYTATCTSGERQAAQAVVRKHFGDDAAQTVRPLTNATEIRERIGNFLDDPKRKQVFGIWTFDTKSKTI